jgi:hypothetical protein
MITLILESTGGHSVFTSTNVDALVHHEGTKATKCREDEATPQNS